MGNLILRPPFCWTPSADGSGLSRGALVLSTASKLDYATRAKHTPCPSNSSLSRRSLDIDALEWWLRVDTKLPMPIPVDRGGMVAHG